MWRAIKEFMKKRAIRRRKRPRRKARWLCEPGEISLRGRALMLGAVGGVSGPLASTKNAQAQREAKEDNEPSDQPKKSE